MRLNKQAVNNILQMSFVQGLNYILPLIMIPYLLRTIGVENYGRVAVATAIVQFLLIISDFGFNFTATQKIAVKGKIDNKLISTIYIYKIIILLVILLVTILGLFYIKNRDEILFVFGFFVFFIGQSLIPAWLFRGINKMVYVSLLTFISKLTTLILLFAYINQTTDYYLMGLIYGVPSFITMILSYFIIRTYGFKFVQVSWEDLKEELSYGKDMFLSNIVGTFYTTLNPIILTIIAGPYATGIYSTCEKIIGVLNSMTNAVSQAVYPIVCKKINENPYLEVKKYKIPISFLFFGWFPPFILVVSLVLNFNSEWILELVNGSDVPNGQISLLNIMIFIPFAISLGHLLGIQSLLPLNERVSVRNSIFKGAILNLILGTAGTLIFGVIGMGTSVLICEFVVSLSMFFYLVRYFKTNNRNKVITPLN
ncbi:oligosaccharide flippase family protein [Fictibacillus norfolkensis]|uniref:Oligosaccharide flippase family protein n=1 Tax=Fictibacillus norfolkensis TaxID=2762233 RepID=A0ABR8SI77_9BACL|nr:oligosaccharide flippase family protein [Fictibacillus norfolkensis]MBD7963182.1 oligosaccharide flippase family protein [Fictibacillus norfolkensis]